MKILTLFVILLIANAQSCEKSAFPKDVPTCIQQKIAEIRKADVRNPPAAVWQYQYKGQTVYYIPSYCCDIPSQLFNEKCELICSPDGGFTGKGDGKCSDFFTTRTNGKLIWQDDRK